MKHKHLLLSALPLLALASCQGRHADGTPKGETVEVDIPEADSAAVAAAAAQQAMEIPQIGQAPGADSTAAPVTDPALSK